jgi:DNA-binding CsgD family transcriptional regulator
LELTNNSTRAPLTTEKSGESLPAERIEGITCLIHSNHALAFGLIKDALSSDVSLPATIKPYSAQSRPTSNSKLLQILIVDTCSVQNWVSSLEKWQSEGGLSIGLVSSDPVNNEMELQLLHHGASAILRSADNLTDELPRAVHAVAKGQLWIRRDVLDLYVKKTRTILHNATVHDRKLTTRERQVLALLHGNLPNRIIAQRLALSERTIKFHVSNILKKLNLRSRRELKSLDRSENILLFESSKAPLSRQPNHFPGLNYAGKTN